MTMSEVILELRQQLADRDAEVAELKNNVTICVVRIEELRQQLAMFKSAVEHVTEDGCTRRSFVAMPEGWAMVHKDRLHALELAEEQLAEARAEVEQAFREGFRSPATYNDTLVNDEDTEWEKYKERMK